MKKFLSGLMLMLLSVGMFNSTFDIGPAHAVVLQHVGANIRIYNWLSNDSRYVPEMYNVTESMGLNIVRITGMGCKWGVWESVDDYIAITKEILSGLVRKGMKAIILLEDASVILGDYGLAQGMEKIKQMLWLYVTQFVNNNGIFAWDIWNEPPLETITHPKTGETFNMIKDVLKPLCQFIRQIDPTHWVTIGGWFKNWVLNKPEDGALIVDLVDIYSPHIYAPADYWLTHITEMGATPTERIENARKGFLDAVNEHKKYSKGKQVFVQEWGINIHTVYSKLKELATGRDEEWYRREADSLAAQYYEGALNAIFEASVNSLFWNLEPTGSSGMGWSPIVIINGQLVWLSAAYTVQKLCNPAHG